MRAHLSSPRVSAAASAAPLGASASLAEDQRLGAWALGPAELLPIDAMPAHPRAERARIEAEPDGGPFGKMLSQLRDILRPLAQTWQVDREDVDPVPEVGAELPVADHRSEVAMGGGDDPHVDMQLVLPADPLEAPILQNAQQAHLHGRRELANLIEEQGAAVGALEPTFALSGSAGEAAARAARGARRGRPRPPRAAPRARG